MCLDISSLLSDQGGGPEVTFQGWRSLHAPQQLLTACICMACRDPRESPTIVFEIHSTIQELYQKLHCGREF